jgi:hypothetical protein
VIAKCNAESGGSDGKARQHQRSMHPYRDSGDDRLAELIRTDAAQSNVRSIRRWLTALCAVSSVSRWLPPPLGQLTLAVWITSGVMALVCFVEERRLGRLRERELRGLDL